MENAEQLIEVDGRHRISLGPLARHSRYLAAVEADGTIVLTPAVVMPAAQAALLAAGDTSAAVDAFLGDPATGISRHRPND